jgi:hypothetical protein
MRTTFAIDDDLLRDLKRRAQEERTSLTKLVNNLLRKAVNGPAPSATPKKPYREKTYSLGRPLVDMTKALALASELEDEEIIRKMELRK